jgi:predicted phage tail protein
MKGAESIVDLVIGAPASPIGVNWVPGVFQATVYPISKTTLTTDTAYEFYYAGENQITDPAKITTSAQFTGRGYQWTFGGMNTGHTYYVYVRTRNAFGVSDFVEASGKPTENFDEISDYVTKDVMNSEQFKGMVSDIKDLGDRTDIIESATADLKTATADLKTATDGLKADTDTLKKDTEALYKKVEENADEIGKHEVRIDSLEVSNENVNNELAQTKASLQNASLALINNSLAQTNTRVTLTAQYKKGRNETKAQIDRIDNVIAEEKKSTAESLETITAEISAMDSNTKGEIARVDKAIATETQARTEAISNVNASISSLENKTNASVSRLDKAISDETQARSDAITEVKADLTTLENNTNASVSRLDQAIADESSARAQAISGISAELGLVENKVDKNNDEIDQAKASLQNASLALINNSIAQSKASTVIEAKYRKGQIKTKAEIARIDTAIADETQARAEAISSLEANINENISAKITDISTALATHEASSAEKFVQISASFDDVNSSITEWSRAMATADEALSTRIDQLKVTINGNTTAIETTSKALTDFKGNVDASYSIKIATDKNGMKYATGMSLGLTGSGTNVQSQCIFLVDRFVLMTAAGGSYQTPFYVTNGACYIRDAWIRDASITTAKIAQQIQSTNYKAGSAGWMLNKNGNAEFNNVTVRGTVYATSGKFTGEIQATSGKFKGTVEAKSFVGDVANMGVGPDRVLGHNGSYSATITYKDSTDNALNSVPAPVTVFPLTAIVPVV